MGEVRRRPYLISEFVHGRNLSELPKPVEPARLVEIGLGLARGLAAAHRRGVLHCDIKPANAMITEEGEVKLLDFGLARLLDRTGPATQPLDAVAGQAVGSPMYMAPELWRGEPATRASDVYSIGVFLYELASGIAPDSTLSFDELGRARQERDVAPLHTVAPQLDPRLCAIIDRCLLRDPSQRCDSGETLREGLESLLVSARAAVPEGNPYRGLLSFDAEHQSLFFGRDSEARAIVDRLRAEAIVVVAGDSGVGKSSLCRAGVLPRLDGRVLALAPGRQPLAALVAALVSFVAGDERELLAALQEDPATLARLLRRQAPVLVFIDQLEELATLAVPDEAKVVAEALAALTASAAGVRLLATVRSDFLTRLATLPALGPEFAPALYLLPALSAEGVRDAIVGPAHGHRLPLRVTRRWSSAGRRGRRGGRACRCSSSRWPRCGTRATPAPSGDPRRRARRASAARRCARRHADRVLAAMLPAEREAARQRAPPGHRRGHAGA